MRFGSPLACVVWALVGCSVNTEVTGGRPDAAPPWDGCIVAAESCNGFDDDCDGLTDEDFDLQTSLMHCGACNAACPSDPPNGSSSCMGGACVLACADRFASCDADDANGCETSLSTAVDCGACGAMCPSTDPFCDASGATPSCVPTCPGRTMMCGTACIDVSSDPANCGTCDNVCPTPGSATATCVGGSCSFDCDPGYADCDGAPDACETALGTTTACAACGDVCDVPGAVARCVSAGCEYTCMSGLENCDTDWSNGCETDVTTETACGSCGNVCSTDNATPMCVAGACQLTCDTGYDDCDADPSTGCEADVSTVAMCGACGTSCSTSQGCYGALCIGPCDDGSRCDGGCESGCTCATGPGLCRYGCGATCTITCNSVCTVQAPNRDAVAVSCATDVDCTVNAQGAASVDVSCTGTRADCSVDCRGVASCAFACRSSADCELYCSGSGACSFSECAAGTVDCGGGRYVCSRSC